VRRSIDVIDELLVEMNRLVSSYEPSVGRTGTSFPNLIQGTAFFPGGSGLWRGVKNGGAMPEVFPSHPVMFVAHNYDSKKGHNEALQSGGEVESPFWTRFWLPMLAFAGVDLTKCFFTNVLMGLQPERATGKMPAVDGYKSECRAFLLKQIAIVEPSVVITLGRAAQTISDGIIPRDTNIRHPSDSYHFSPLATREERLREVGAKIRTLIGSAQGHLFNSAV
jgi:hypothetical protein